MDSENHESNRQLNFQDMQSENTNYFNQLTNKNKEYMIKLNRVLEHQLTDAERTEVFYEMLPTIAEEQKKGVTARALYGTVIDKAQDIMGQPTEKNKAVTSGTSENWKLYLDSALMLGGLFAVVQGISGFFDVESAQGGAMGIVSLVLNFVIGGFVGLLMTKYAPKKGDQNALGRYLFVSTAAMIVWVLIMMGVILAVPATINILLDPMVIFGVGVGAILLKVILKRVLNIRGTLM